ncbi:Response regulator PleD [compost metagenome]
MVLCSFGIFTMSKDRDMAHSHKLAFTDDLTGLYNRRYVQHALEQQVAQALRMQQPLSLLLLDVDFFKRINDTYGHLCGDQVLRDLATCLNQLLRAGDIAGRWGGEEFMIILPMTDAAGASALAERVRKAVQKNCFLTSHDTMDPVTVSIGVHALPRIGAANPHSMLTVADQALYIAKNGGRNQIYVL